MPDAQPPSGRPRLPEVIAGADGAAQIVAARARAVGGRPVVLLDGRSGAGKTVLARRLAPLLDAQLVSLDDLYPGWDGLAAGADAAAETVLRDRDPGWRRWDWTAEAAAEWHAIDPRRPLVVEGCGAIGRASRSRADLAVWIELDPRTRRRRALARDGAAYEPHWERWAAQEQSRLDSEGSTELADLIIRA